ncbi:hypothetical protein [Cupriavidus sp. TMH.W2]|uniref:hypothetical protein n=1 Tax=Cupriavidus sp. TMH.W2 TaxID=3434465 RepID=UPI003D77F9B4
MITLTALLSLLPPLAWGSPLTTTLYREVVVPAGPELSAIHAGIAACDPARAFPHAVFGSLGLPYRNGAAALDVGTDYRLKRPVSLGQRLLLTGVSRDTARLSMRFNKSLAVHAGELPPALQRLLPDATASAVPPAFALSTDGRVLSCQLAGDRR